ncbi:MAG: signal peptidase II [Rhodospirillales bacterium]
MNKAQRSGLFMIGATIVLDQLTKYLALEGISAAEPISIFPFLDLKLTWNQGVSFGIFGGGSVPPFVLILIAILISMFLIWQLWNSKKLILGMGFGLIIGGALGNVIDRAIYGAVIDFILLSWKSWSWPVFNVADMAISCGVGLIIIDSLWPGRRSTT